eukprot:GHVS01094932.1.p1 GENE.GHVS01094932.1~~GHVS01094932.1.p1  ORF type:complete len:388 (+),score=102.11 GHVS01094932.1:96-1259(+)
MEEDKPQAEVSPDDFDLYEGIVAQDHLLGGSGLIGARDGLSSDEDLPPGQEKGIVFVDIDLSSVANNSDKGGGGGSTSSLHRSGRMGSGSSFGRGAVMRRRRVPVVGGVAGKMDGRKRTRKMGFVRKDIPLFLGAPPKLVDCVEPRSSSHVIIACNLAWWITDVGIREAASSSGQVRAVKVLDNPLNGKSLGVALIEYCLASSASHAVQNLAKMLMATQGGERVVRVEAATEAVWTQLDRSAPMWTAGGGIHEPLHSMILQAIGILAQKPPPPPPPPPFHHHHHHRPQTVRHHQRSYRPFAPPPPPHRANSDTPKPAGPPLGGHLVDPGLPPPTASVTFPWFDPTILEAASRRKRRRRSGGSSSSSDSSRASSSPNRQPPPPATTGS